MKKNSLYGKALAVILAAGMIGTTGAISASAVSTTDLVKQVINTNVTIPLDSSPIVLIQNRTYKLPEISSVFVAGQKYNIGLSNSNTVKVLSDGTIKANAVGTVTLTIKTANGKIIKKTITVKAPEVKITVDKTALTLGKGETYLLKALSSTGLKNLKWSSTNTKVASVDSNGKITAKSNGTANISVKNPNGKIATCKITVKKAPNKLTLNKGTLTLGLGENFNLDYTLPGNVASYNVKFSSNKNNVASVNPTTGVVKTNKTGTVTITAKTYNGKTAACVINVKNPPKTITLNKKNVTLKVGDKVALKATLPNGSASSKISFYPANSRIVNVSWNGVITAKSKGTTTVTAKTYNGKTVTCKVTVK